MTNKLDDLASHFQQIIAGLGENPDREGLQDTPIRAAKAMQFLTQGYRQSLDTFRHGRNGRGSGH